MSSPAAHHGSSVLSAEIIPFVEANYRTTPGDRGLAGYSTGGLFTLDAL